MLESHNTVVSYSTVINRRATAFRQGLTAVQIFSWLPQLLDGALRCAGTTQGEKVAAQEVSTL